MNELALDPGPALKGPAVGGVVGVPGATPWGGWVSKQRTQGPRPNQSGLFS